MIELTRLNGSLLVVNSELIQHAESVPDTTLTLLNGEKIVVRESPAKVIDLAVAYRARILAEAAKHSPTEAVQFSACAIRSEPANKGAAPGDEIEPSVNYVARRRAIHD
ncbi:MAG: flagellar FlbD family protein [Acidobacteriaceae bacterium]|nr:flagellar FlbD family protein [Acidobacteriaceae bacterium]